MRRRIRNAAYRARRKIRQFGAPRNVQRRENSMVAAEQESNYNQSVAASLAGRL
jgi:hypothetical protein